MKRVILVLLAAVAILFGDSVSAQLRTSYFMEGSYFRNELNPALAPTRGYLALPVVSGLGVGLNTNFLSVDNLFYQKDGQVVTALHNSVSADEFLGKMPETAKMNINANINVLGLGFYVKKSYWTLGLNLRTQNDVAISKDLFRALKTLGNGRYDLGNTALGSTSFLETYLGSSFRVCDWINIGIKAKFLVGLLNVSTEMDSINANVAADGVTAQVRGMLRAGGFIFSSKQAVAGQPIDENIINTDLQYMLNNLGSLGGAIDVGAEFRLLNDHLRISAAITDLGFIHWSKKSHVAANVEADFAYRGFNLETGERDGDSSAEMTMVSTEQKGYTRRLNFSVNVGIEYNILNNHIAFGLLSHNEFASNNIMPELTASVNFRPTSWISATVSHTFLGGVRPGVLGCALNIHPAGLNLFVGMDYLGLAQVKYNDINIPRYQNSVNVYAGLGFNFGRPKALRKAKEE